MSLSSYKSYILDIIASHQTMVSMIHAIEHAPIPCSLPYLPETEAILKMIVQHLPPDVVYTMADNTLTLSHRVDSVG